MTENPDLERLLVITRHLTDASTHDYLYEKLVAEENQLKEKIEKALENYLVSDDFTQTELSYALLNYKQNEEFRKEIDNLMISLEVFDDDRHKAGERMIHGDALARYRQIIQKIEDGEKK